MIKGITHTTNPTRIIRIHKKRLSIEIKKDAADRTFFDYQTINLKGLDIKQDAAVYMYISAGNVELGFDLGSVASISKPKYRFLELPNNKKIWIRLLVVDQETSRIIASAENISAQRSKKENRDSILPVVFRDLGNEIWRMSLREDEPPELHLHQKFPYIKELLTSDQEYMAVIYPQVLRMTLRHYIDNPADNSTDSWQYKWLRFLNEDMGFKKDPPPNKEETEKTINDWINKVVQQFSKILELFDNAKESINNKHK